MVQLIAWLAVCVLICVALRKRLVQLLIIVIALRVAVPGVSAHLLVGTNNGLHPATWLLLTVAALAVVRYPRSVIRELRHHELMYLVVVALIGEALGVTLAKSDIIWIIVYVNTIGAGFLLLFLVRIARWTDPLAVEQVARALLAIGVVEASLAIVQLLVGNSIFYTADRATLGGYDPASTRSVGTLDSPIDLAMTCVIAIPLASQIRSATTRLAFAAVLVVGAVVSQSRTGAAVAIIACVLLLALSKMTIARRGILTFLAAAAGAWVLLSDNPISEGLSDRISNDAFSATYRDYALNYFFSQVPQEPLTGYGLGASASLHDAGVLFSSLENGYAMYAYDLGVPFVILLLSMFAAIVIRGWASALPGAALAAVSALIMAASYSGIFNSGAASALLFAAIALADRWTSVGPCPSVLTRIVEEGRRVLLPTNDKRARALAMLYEHQLTSTRAVATRTSTTEMAAKRSMADTHPQHDRSRQWN